MSERDPFPRDRLAETLHRLPAYARLAWSLVREPVLSRVRRAALVGAAGYLASPIDLVPGVIPVLGQLDDLAVALAAIRLALSGLSPERRRAHLAAVGLEEAHLSADVRTLGATTAWIVRAGGRTAGRAVQAGGRAMVRGTKIVGGLAVRTGGGVVASLRQAGPRVDAIVQRAGPRVDGAVRRLPRLRRPGAEGAGEGL